MFKKILLTSLLLIFLVMAFKGQILRACIVSSVEKKLGGRCGLSYADVSLLGLRLKDFSYLKNGSRFTFKDAEIGIDLSRFPEVGLSSLILTEAELSINDFAIDAGIKRSAGSLHVLNIQSLRIKDKEKKDILIPLKFGARQIVFPEAPNALLGKDSRLKGFFNFALNQIRLELEFKDVSSSDILQMFADKDSLDLDGAFSGSLVIHLKSGSLERLELELLNDQGGFIRIKNDAQLDFLKKYLDDRSYKALVDNFKNYSYNKGTIQVKKEDTDVVTMLHFDSPVMGNKGVIIDVHRIAEEK